MSGSFRGEVLNFLRGRVKIWHVQLEGQCYAVCYDVI
jgi:hypothetical protein